MNRRQFLASSTAAFLAAPALLRQASAQEGPFRVKYFPVAPGSGSRDTAAAPDGTIWYCGQRNGTLGRLDPKDGSFKQVDLGKGAKGYIATGKLRSQLAYRLIASSRNGKWSITSLVAGD